MGSWPSNPMGQRWRLDACPMADVRALDGDGEGEDGDGDGGALMIIYICAVMATIPRRSLRSLSGRDAAIRHSSSSRSSSNWMSTVGIRLVRPDFPVSCEACDVSVFPELLRSREWERRNRVAANGRGWLGCLFGTSGLGVARCGQARAPDESAQTDARPMGTERDREGDIEMLGCSSPSPTTAEGLRQTRHFLPSRNRWLHSIQNRQMLTNHDCLLGPGFVHAGLSFKSGRTGRRSVYVYTALPSFAEQHKRRSANT